MVIYGFALSFFTVVGVGLTMLSMGDGQHVVSASAQDNWVSFEGIGGTFSSLDNWVPFICSIVGCLFFAG